MHYISHVLGRELTWLIDSMRSFAMTCGDADPTWLLVNRIADSRLADDEMVSVM